MDQAVMHRLLDSPAVLLVQFDSGFHHDAKILHPRRVFDLLSGDPHHRARGRQLLFL